MPLNALEEQIMKLFWKLDKAFPKEIIAYLDDPKPPYNTILSTIRKLEKEGWLGYRVFGKSHQYYPLIERKQFNQSLFRNFFHKHLGGSRSSLLSYFMEEEKLEIEELEQLVKSLKNKS